MLVRLNTYSYSKSDYHWKSRLFCLVFRCHMNTGTFYNRNTSYPQPDLSGIQMVTVSDSYYDLNTKLLTVWYLNVSSIFFVRFSDLHRIHCIGLTVTVTVTKNARCNFDKVILIIPKGPMGGNQDLVKEKNRQGYSPLYSR